ncbi:hypothetical protein BDB00DRAFT_352176 [Zychaea mexicana]|uniref:uncharacterized protein n=1 Tax=Zychaea mexicana TaxID=64656 RepID=UPI0022FF45CA|nr:uncharacterized protein BDB00DRAFT_352176 [Zychaea mexicana]KAI9493965.1 hypothetical protein BDB00DRAFT_352176 [Zychaea mexicana]
MIKEDLLYFPELVKPGDSYAMFTVTQLDLSTTLHDFDQGKYAYTNGDYNEAVAFYTQVIDNLRTNLAAALCHRAAAYEMQNQYELAFEDSKLDNAIDDYACPDAYLIAASAQYLQGDVCRAARIYKHGSAAVASLIPSTSAHPAICDEMLAKHDQIMAAVDKRNGWMTRLLPSEVISNILNQLSIDDRFRLAWTSHFWLNYIINWPYLLRVISKNQKVFGALERTKKLLQSIPDRRNQGKEIELCFAGGNGENIFHALVAEKWSGIETLELERHNMNCFVETNVRLWDLDLRDLTTLKLFSEPENKFNNAIFPSIVSFCPKLKNVIHQFFTDCTVINLDKIPSALPDSSLQLTSLHWNDFVRITDFRNLLNRFTALKVLVITREFLEERAKALMVVNATCPVLESFVYKDKIKKYVEDFCTVYTEPSASPHQGLTKLVLTNEQRDDYEKDINIDEQLLVFLEKHNETLEILEVAQELLEPGVYTSLERLAQIGVPNLRILRLTSINGCSLSSQILSNLIRACPSLQVASITGVGVLDDRVLRALGTAATRQLQQLNIYIRHYVPSADEEENIEEDDDGVIATSEIPAQGAGVVSSMYNQERLRYTTDGIKALFNRNTRIHEFTIGYDSTSSEARNDVLLLDIVKYINSTNVRSLNLRRFPLNEGLLYTVLKGLLNSQVRTLQIGVDCMIQDHHIDVLASMKHLTHLIVYNPSRSITKDTLCKLFNKWHKRRLLVVRVDYEGKESISGCKRDSATIPKDSDDHPHVQYLIQSVKHH